MQHAFANGLCKAVLLNSKKVIDINTGKEYSNIAEAAKVFQIPYSTFKNYLNGNRGNPTCLRLAI
jgi:hypothetical protein